jgi:acetylornithine deacetylase/succinyl-diaminopimelate desuccinylase family protein
VGPTTDRCRIHSLIAQRAHQSRKDADMTEDAVRRVLAAIEGSRERIVDDVKRLVEVPSVNPNYPGVRPEDYLGQESEANLLLRDRFGYLFDSSQLVKSVAKRENLAGVVKGGGTGRSLLLNGHIDVVPAGNLDTWTGDPFVAKVASGRIHGRGASDMKSGVVAAFSAIEAIRTSGIDLAGDLVVHSVAGEELGEHEVGTGCVLEHGYTADAAIVVEPSASFDSPLTINPTAASLLWGRVRVEGLAGHPGLRRELIRAGGAGARAGVNAIDKGYLVLQALYGIEEQWGLGKQRPLFKPGHFVVMPGTIHGRGKDIDIPFVFAEYCEIDFIVWYPPEDDADAVKLEIESFVNRSVSLDPWLTDHPPTYEWLVEFPGFSTQNDHEIVRTLGSAHEQGTGLTAIVEAFPAACDATWIARTDIPVVNYGPGHLANAHKPNEYCDVDEIISATKSLALTALDWCGVR